MSSLLELTDPKTRYIHDLRKAGKYICSIFPDDSIGVQTKNPIRMVKSTEENVEPRPRRHFRVILGPEKQRNLFLTSARSRDDTDIRERPSKSLEDRIKASLAGQDLRLVGFK